MSDIMLKELLEAGVHFGHQKRKWNPKTKRYIFGQRNGICIIDLEKTIEALRKAAQFLEETAFSGGQILFVGTKNQAQEIISREAERCGMHYVNTRWLGGTLTNFGTVYGRIKKLRELEDESEESVGHLTKKEKLVRMRLKEKLQKNLGGIKNLNRVPDALIVVDAQKGRIPIFEAVKMNIPVVAMVDTNTDPELVKMPIPANDDAIKSISLIVTKLADAVIEGLNRAGKTMEEEQPEGEAPSEPEGTEEEKKDESHILNGGETDGENSARENQAAS